VFMCRYLTRANNWSPETAAKANHLRKKRGNQMPPIYLFIQADSAIQAYWMNVHNETSQRKGSTGFTGYTRKSSVDQGHRKMSIEEMSRQRSVEPSPSGSPYLADPHMSPSYERRPSVDARMGRKFSADRVNRNVKIYGQLEQGSTTSLSERQSSLKGVERSRAGSQSREISDLSGQRRGSAEQLLQQVLDECESLIGSFQVKE
jgi:hypothetical protein